MSINTKEQNIQNPGMYFEFGFIANFDIPMWIFCAGLLKCLNSRVLIDLRDGFQGWILT